MARITVEDCLDNIPNRFQLVRLTSKRAKQLLAGDTAVTDTRGNKAVVSALREIADGKVRFVQAEDTEPAAEEAIANGHTEFAEEPAAVVPTESAGVA